jgi:hypothetical protein
MTVIKNSDITVIGITEKTVPILVGMNPREITALGYRIHGLNNPLGQKTVVIIEKTNLLRNLPSLPYY